MSESKKRHRYKHVQGKRLIEVRVKSTSQLFDARDPAPFRERDLDDDFVEYVLTSAQEFSSKRPLKIVIHLDEGEADDLPKESIREAIVSYFSYKIDVQRVELKSFIKKAQFFFLVGAILLAACLALAQTITPLQHLGLLSIFREGLVIIGWVSMWKPIELLLYDWYPKYENLKLLKKIHSAEIEILFKEPS